MVLEDLMHRWSDDGFKGPHNILAAIRKEKPENLEVFYKGEIRKDK